MKRVQFYDENTRQWYDMKNLFVLSYLYFKGGYQKLVVLIYQH